MTVGRTDSEKDVEPRWLGGAAMVWSHFDTPTTLAILNNVGFEIVEVRQVPEMLDNRRLMHPFVVARRS